MTTRAERLARAESLARTQLERQRTRLAKVQARQREEERKALTKRRGCTPGGAPLWRGAPPAGRPACTCP